MKRNRYKYEQVAFALRQAESGTALEEICRLLGVSEPTFYRWKKQFAGMGYWRSGGLSNSRSKMPRCSGL